MEIKIKVYFLNDNLNNDYNQYKSAKNMEDQGDS